jgi:hypothetical protein
VLLHLLGNGILLLLTVIAMGAYARSTRKREEAKIAELMGTSPVAGSGD